MVSYSLVYHRGPNRFLAEAAAAGLAGAIVPDLPVEEAARAGRHGRRARFQTHPARHADDAARPGHRDRPAIDRFVYVVSVTGITGARDQLPPELLEQLRWLRTQTELPLCVGFGISKPEHVRMLRESVDGIIVGSALVRRLEDVGRRPAAR